MTNYRIKFYVSKFGPRCPANGWHVEKLHTFFFGMLKIWFPIGYSYGRNKELAERNAFLLQRLTQKL